MRLHFLAAEGATHPQALHRDVAARQMQDVADDFLGFARMLRAGLNEELTRFVDVGQGRVGLQVEVLLAAELEFATEPVCSPLHGTRCIAAFHRALVGLVTLLLDRLGDRDDRGQRLISDLDGVGAVACGLLGLPDHPADRVPVEHDLAGEERLVALDPGVVDPRNVVGGEHPDDAFDVIRRVDVERRDGGVGDGGLQGPRVQTPGCSVDEVIGVERGPSDVQVGALVRDLEPDFGVDRTIGQRAVCLAHRSDLTYLGLVL